MNTIPEVHLAQWFPAVRRAAAVLVWAGALSAGLHGSLQGLGQGLGQDGLPRTLDRDFYRRPYPQLVKRVLRPALLTLTFETEPNDDFMTANPIVLGDTVGGDIDPVGDVDYFAIDLIVGERVDFDIDAFGIGSSADPVLTLYGTDGVTLLDISDNVVGLDPRIVFEPLASGRYFVAVDDAAGGGGPS
ncbi:MAG: PPC domain-containing protein, partial [Gemmatimonadetes bacterium]|nr:PPC domain-containing protein [Gemmatimonadota bacterium]